MSKNNQKLSNSEIKFLNVILDKGNVSDTEITKLTGLSKSSCSRIRKKLEKNLISEYIPIIPLEKIGLDVFLVLTFQWNAFDNQEFTKKSFSTFKKNPNVVFLANGEGSSSSTVMFIAFKNLEEYHEFLKKFRRDYGKYALQINTLLLPSKEVIKNDFTEVIKKTIGGNHNEK
jgi:DNA-binding Lrp family transcriptional regulator